MLKFARNFTMWTVLTSSLLLMVGCDKPQKNHSKVSKPIGNSSTHSTPMSPPPSPTPPSPPPPVSCADQNSRICTVRKALPYSAYHWVKDKDSQYKDEFYLRCVYPEETGPTGYGLSYGSVLDELFQVRSFIREYYIFNDEVVDLDPRLYYELSSNFDEHFENMTDKDSFFQKMRSKAKLANGSPKHGLFEVRKEKVPFRHFEYGYGIIWEKLSEDPPRNYIVKSVLGNSPAWELGNETPKVNRGDKLTKINDLDFVLSDGDDVNKKIKKWLEPDDNSEVTKFEFIDRDTKTAKTVFLKPEYAAGYDFQFTKLIKTNSGSVGYISLGRAFNSFYSVYEAIKEFKKNAVKDVIIDIRYYNKEENGSDTHRTEPMLLYSVVGKENTDGKQFRNRISREAAVARWYEAKKSIPFYSKCLAKTINARNKKQCWQSADRFYGFSCGFLWLYRCRYPTYDFELESLNLSKVYLLTSKDTCHVGELIINALLGIDVEVVQIGEQTCGSSYLAYSKQKNCGIKYEIYDTKFTNNKNEGDYQYGFKPKNTKSDFGIELPGCYVKDDLTKELGNIEENVLAAALQYRKDGTCPNVPSESSEIKQVN